MFVRLLSMPTPVDSKEKQEDEAVVNLERRTAVIEEQEWSQRQEKGRQGMRGCGMRRRDMGGKHHVGQTPGG